MKQELIGRTIEGRYRLDQLLGEGAMGAVYAGWQLAVDRKVAIKLLHPFLSRRKDFNARFELEAKAVARLSNPHCLTLFDFGFDEELDLFYMVVEFIDGVVLADRLDRRMPVEECLRTTLQIAEALEHAHSQGILHRDLKPENIMITTNTPKPMAKVLDFGLARLFQEEDDADMDSTTKRRRRLTKAGEVYGTPAYMSPEQCRGSRELTVESDLYSLGVMLYEMLDGRLPFHCASPAELMLKQINDPVPPMEAEVTPDVLRLVEWLLMKAPEARPASASAVIEVLRARLSADSTQDFPTFDSMGSETPERLNRKPKVNLWLVGLLVLLVGVILGVKVVSNLVETPASAALPPISAVLLHAPAEPNPKPEGVVPIVVDREADGESNSIESDSPDAGVDAGVEAVPEVDEGVEAAGLRVDDGVAAAASAASAAEKPAKKKRKRRKKRRKPKAKQPKLLEW